MTYLDNVAREVHEKYYNRGFLNMENEEIREICEITHASREKAEEALSQYRHPITREEKRAAKEKQKAIKLRTNNYVKEYIKNNTDINVVAKNNADFIDEIRCVQAESKIPKCPRCHSTAISYDTKKLSVGRGVVGGLVAGTPGMIMGGLSSKKGYCVCLNCGKRWKI